MFTINPEDDFLVQLLGTQHRQHDIEALDIHPITNQIFAAAGDEGIENGHLYQVNADTGALTRIGNPSFKAINGLSFHPNGELWEWAVGECSVTHLALRIVHACSSK